MDNNLGTGWAFPVNFDQEDTIKLINSKEDIEQSLHILLSTKPGERPLFFDFGCDLHRMTYENINEELKIAIRKIIAEAINKFEKRITLNDIIIDENQSTSGLLNIMIEYTINQTLLTTSYIYPFYFEN
ncbi:GPW/gp25 family protein [Persicobacter psychrovividus]|uniref:Baseplate protein n=1 Tax=Persicobacter psychrovividus TaxID=387638 RepID=A0ABM7VK38_9BACT|nr:baseplate protein [Persicobacter psychrovividus]